MVGKRIDKGSFGSEKAYLWTIIVQQRHQEEWISRWIAITWKVSTTPLILTVYFSQITAQFTKIRCHEN